MSTDPEARRPLKSRSTVWAGFFSRAMLRAGLRPNLVSVMSLVFAAMAGGAAWWAFAGAGAPWVFWILAAVGIQLRLFCNLMDGLLAVEGGLKSATGELFNEIPDRLADALILVPLGYATGTVVGIALGWAAAVGSVFTAYVRALGAALTGIQDFRGPMAKPHRMAACTLGCLGMVVAGWQGSAFPVLFWSLVVINAGILMTAWRRMVRLATNLKKASNTL